MPKNSDAKTVLVRKNLTVFIIGIILIVAGLGLFIFQGSQSQLHANNHSISLEKVDTPEDLTRGLSGRLSLPQNHGMLFVFPDDNEHCFWMKDMKFSLDIIWLNEQKQIVDIAHNVSPETYPNSFCSTAPARYVLEVNGGKANEWDWSPGTQVSF